MSQDDVPLSGRSTRQLQDLTVDPFGVGSSKEGNDLGDIVGNTDTAERAEVGESTVDGFDWPGWVCAGNVVPCILRVHVRFDSTGSNGIDCDALVAAVDGERTNETLDGGFAAGV